MTQETTSSKECYCLYWAPFTCSCLLITNGLLLPLKEYILLYCHTNRFFLCPHYQQLANAEELTETEPKKPMNHRRSIRFPGYHDFYFSKLIGKHLLKTREENTWTFDISDYGVRFASDQSLTRDAAIHFLVKDDEIATTVEGVGRVVWCDPLKHTPLFQVGVAIDWLFR